MTDDTTQMQDDIATAANDVRKTEENQGHEFLGHLKDEFKKRFEGIEGFIQHDASALWEWLVSAI